MAILINNSVYSNHINKNMQLDHFIICHWKVNSSHDAELGPLCFNFLHFFFFSFFFLRARETDGHRDPAPLTGSLSKGLQERVPTQEAANLKQVSHVWQGPNDFSHPQYLPGSPWQEAGAMDTARNWSCVLCATWGVGRGHLNQQAKCLLLPVLLTLTSQNHNEQHMSTTDMTEQCSTNNRPPSLSGWKKLMLTKRDIYI